MIRNGVGEGQRTCAPRQSKGSSILLCSHFNYPFYLCSTILIISSHSGDCGVYMPKFIEFHMIGRSLKDLITNYQMGHYRKRYAAESFEQGMEP